MTRVRRMVARQQVPPIRRQPGHNAHKSHAGGMGGMPTVPPGAQAGSGGTDTCQGRHPPRVGHPPGGHPPQAQRGRRRRPSSRIGKNERQKDAVALALSGSSSAFARLVYQLMVYPT